MAAKTPVRDVVIWAKHVHGDHDLIAKLTALRGGETIDLLVDGVRGVWRKMADGKDGRSTNGIRPVGSAQTVWKGLYTSRRGDVVDVELAPPGFVPRPRVYPALGRTDEERTAALERFLDAGRRGPGSEGRTITRDEMNER